MCKNGKGWGHRVKGLMKGAVYKLLGVGQDGDIVARLNKVGVWGNLNMTNNLIKYQQIDLQTDLIFQKLNAFYTFI